MRKFWKVGEKKKIELADWCVWEGEKRRESFGRTTRESWSSWSPVGTDPS